VERERTSDAVLYLVPTPIGNLEDITLRALRVLGEVDTIACEDTRVTSSLLRHLGIASKRLISNFAGNESSRSGQIVDILRAGADVALVCDAGSPGISDPGTRLVSSAIAAGVRVVPLPGATAFVPALAASGLPTDAFVFEGFLPHKKGRQTAIKRLAEESRTVVLYESPHRIVRTLTEMCSHFGEDRNAAIGRELTKHFEEINRGTLGTLRDLYAARQAIKGEFVIVIGGQRSLPAERRRR